jgi:hypothetical protein
MRECMRTCCYDECWGAIAETQPETDIASVPPAFCSIAMVDNPFYASASGGSACCALPLVLTCSALWAGRVPCAIALLTNLQCCHVRVLGPAFPQVSLRLTPDVDEVFANPPVDPLQGIRRLAALDLVGWLPPAWRRCDATCQYTALYR